MTQDFESFGRDSSYVTKAACLPLFNRLRRPVGL